METTTLQIIFFISAFILFYAYVGYGLLIKALPKKNQLDVQDTEDHLLPEVTHIIAAFNEEDFLEEKIKNSLMLDYPMDKIRTIIVSDGSTDGTAKMVNSNPRIIGMHSPERKGKMAAIERAMTRVKTPYVVFSDANSILNPPAIKRLMRHFQNETVGAVAGEKVINVKEGNNSSQGEGMYWKYESLLKKMDAQLHTVVGAAGELFALRTSLFKAPEKACIIEDFMLTLNIAEQGYRVAYEPDAKAMESGASDIMQELKRKVRISAGGLQASWRLRHLLNPVKHGLLAFQLFSHRTLRWTLAPLSLIAVFVSSLLLAKTLPFFALALYAQVFFYAIALISYYMERSGKKIKLGLPIFYFAFMNLSVFLGALFLMRQNEFVVWEKTQRA